MGSNLASDSGEGKGGSEWSDASYSITRAIYDRRDASFENGREITPQNIPPMVGDSFRID
ncbi:hypothetical protein HYE67_005825 [Fusarium culmorum]|uniref:Uncharacterized protein n=1 Tax=Fusarium culmorum TaxID=5516 RepID=A0A2T4GDX4_FUSCU|nr:hypothetical protein FCULG_00010401 [Fusarium culmorum]QPC63594.1 hypothetical protein HYE67_005825 [Fusarium culmorum]